MRGLMAKPWIASSMAGSSAKASGFDPYWRDTLSHSFTVPGTPTERPLNTAVLKSSAWPAVL